MIISTWSHEGYNVNNFNLKALPPTHGIYGILCEKVKMPIECPSQCPPNSSCDESTNGQCECVEGLVFSVTANSCLIPTGFEKSGGGFPSS